MPEVLLNDGFMPLVLALSILSGAGSFLQGRREERLGGTLVDLITEVVLALIVGLATAYVSEAYEIKRGITCALVLVLSNNASDTLVWFKKLTFNKISKGLGTDGGKGK